MSIVFLDTETTGFSYSSHSVLNFACIIREDNGKEHTIQRFYYPDPLKEVSYHAIKINHFILYRYLTFISSNISLTAIVSHKAL